MIPSQNFNWDRSLQEISQRPFQIVNPMGESPSASDSRDIIERLNQPLKSIPPRYFYDERGSNLFEQICDLPEYYPTRTEAAILKQYSSDIAQLTGACELVELGSGSSRKTRFLLDAYQSLAPTIDYMPIDVSASIVEQSAKAIVADYPTLAVKAWVGTYEQVLATLNPIAQRLIIFLGSTFGNFTPAEGDRFFEQISAALSPGGYFLLGVDLQKPIAILEAAYNDTQGITAAFNLNLLTHLNRRFQGNFSEKDFKHYACYNPLDHQIEMYLVSLRSQSVHLKSLNLTLDLAAGEKILTEISRKFDLNSLEACLDRHGLAPIRHWTDSQPWFGLILCQKR